MLKQYWKTREFKLLNKEWTYKLHKSGFNDHEVECNGEYFLKQKATNAYRQADTLERETRQDFYLLLGHLAHNTVFPTFLEEVVMKMFSDGHSIKTITEYIAEIGLTRDRKTVRYIIRRWQTNWGVRFWNLKQRNLK